MKRIIIILLVVAVGGVGYGLYLYNKPHKDIQASKVDFELEANELVNEYLENPMAANEKYLHEEGGGILIVTGTVRSIKSDMNNNKVVRLKEDALKAGVSCTFVPGTNENVEKLVPGQIVSIKGVLQSGAGYDEDLELYEDAIMAKCDVIM